jgi:hypothetical protein
MSSCRSAIDQPLRAFGVPGPLHPDPCGGALDLAEIVGLAAADGAVVMSKHNELLGFGGMISGRLPEIKSVGRALDLEGEKVAEERTGNVGARHCSAYRLAGALPGSVAVVISQDGGVRFVCQKDGRVTYWEQE